MLPSWTLPSKLLLTILSEVSLLHKLDAIFMASVTVSLSLSAQTQSQYHIHCFSFQQLTFRTGIGQDILASQDGL